MKGERGMKRIVALFALSLVLLFLLMLPISAAEETLPVEVLEGYETMLDGIPDGVRDDLPDGFFTDDPEELSEAIGEMLNIPYFLRLIGEALGFYVGDALRLFASVLGILILSAVFATYRRSLRTGALGRVFSTAASAALLVAVTETQRELFLQLRTYFSELSTLAGAMIPVSTVLYAMGGNLSGATTGSAMMSVFLAVSELIGGELLFSTVGACMALSLVPTFMGSLNVRSLSSAVKRIFTFSLGFLTMLLSALLAMRAGLAAKADSVGARTVKYVASSVIPVVGGSVADSLRTVGASVEYLRTTVGIAGILLIVLLLLPVLVNVLLTRFCLILGSSFAELLGCDGEGRLLSELVSIYGYVLAVAVLCAVMFIFALTILVRTAAAV